MLDPDRIQRFIPYVLVVAIAVTLSILLSGNVVSLHGDADSVVALACILIIAAFCFVYARKFNNLPLDIGLALFIYAMSVLLILKFTADISPVQRLVVAGIFGIGFVNIGAGLFRARQLQDERITQLSRQKADLSQLSEDLEQANAKLRLLSQITRHDINNQLTLLRGYLHILETKYPEISTCDYFQKAKISAQRITSTIQFTRDYESIGLQTPAWQECHLLVDIAAEQITLGSINLKNELPEKFEVFADPLIVKVFYNLLDNAVRYGGRITMIRFYLQESDRTRIIFCEDDGGGIPADDKEKIFERGFGKNTGLGLTMSREILGITRILLRETGEPKKGSRFEILIPERAHRIADK